MKWSGSAKGTFGIGLLATITADKFGIALECFDFCSFPGFGQFTDMQFVVVRVGAKIINVR
jgi:hypothetical protein